MIVKCVMCGRDVNADTPGVYEQVSGWAQRRASGGTNSLRMRKSAHRYAHKTCVESSAKGRRGQETLAI